MADRVFSVVQELGKARYRALCARLPYARESVTYALKRLKRRGLVLLGRDEQGEFWSVTKDAAMRAGGVVRRSPTESH